MNTFPWITRGRVFSTWSSQTKQAAPLYALPHGHAVQMFGQLPLRNLCYLCYLTLQESQRKRLVTSEEQSFNFPLKCHGLSTSLPLGSPLQFVVLAYIHLDIPFWELHSSTVALLSGAKITSSSSIWWQSPIPFKSALCWAKKIYFQPFFYPTNLKS